ncbi:AAA family ATPase [Streptosporangium sp. NPDC049644]|uniref:AAA family ATPase n=1 Tax=Streptosporangium sp. NPDC049644 TaxID=3155507 RepID=UPI00342BBBBB
MLYKQFKFNNYKGIQNLTLPLNQGVTTLIGLNESGKTTILEAIFCFSRGAKNVEAINPSIALRRSAESWIPVSQRANFNDAITISAIVTLDEKDKQELWQYALQEYDLRLTNVPSEISIEERYSFENSRFASKKNIALWGIRIVGTKGRQRKPRTYGSGDEEWQGIIRYVQERLPKIWYFPDFLFELPERFILSDNKAVDANDALSNAVTPATMVARHNRNRTRNQFYREIFENIIERLGYGATLETHVVRRLQSADKADRRSLNAILLDMGRLVTETVFGGWNRILGRSPMAQEVQIDADLEADGTPFLELKIKDSNGYHDLSERSLGFRWFFMFLLMTSFQKTSDSEPKPLILLDEPASNLHSSAQAELLKSFEKLVEDCNLIYSTHSHHLINIRWLDSAYVIKNSALGSADFSAYLSAKVSERISISAIKYRRFVSENPGQTSYVQPVLDVLHYRPSFLEPIPEVILVEGKSDFYALRYMNEVIGIGSNLKMVPGGGAGSLDALIRLHIGWGKSFLVLLDGDAEGKKQYERYKREFGALITGRCIMLPRACDNEKIRELEDLFSKKDKAEIVSTIFPDVNISRNVSKKNLQHALMELYARKEKVVLESATVEQFKNLLEELEAIMGGL